MLPVIDEGSRRYMASGTAHARIMRKWLCEQRFAATFGFVNRSDEPATGTETWIGQKVDILDIGDDGVEDGWGRLGACELIDDDVANEIAQRGDTAIVAIRREIARTTQARDPDRVEHAIVCFGIEQ